MNNNLDTLKFNHALTVEEEKKAFNTLVDALFSEANKYEIPVDYIRLYTESQYRNEVGDKIYEKYDVADENFPYPKWTSNCCNAPLIEETDICGKCKNHCEPIESL